MGSWDAQNGLRGAPWEAFEKGLSQIVTKVGGGRVLCEHQPKAAVKLEDSKSQRDYEAPSMAVDPQVQCQSWDQPWSQHMERLCLCVPTGSGGEDVKGKKLQH